MSGLVGSKLNIRGSGLVGSLGTDGQHLLSSGAGVSNVFETAAGGGKVGQVVQTTHTGTESIGSATPTTIPNFTVSITPAASSSKILVTCAVNIGAQPSYGMQAQLFRDTTHISLGDANGSTGRNWWRYHGNNARDIRCNSGEFLDSPSTTSEIEYTMKWYIQTGGGTFYMNRSGEDNATATYDGRYISTFTVTEILA